MDATDNVHFSYYCLENTFLFSFIISHYKIKTVFHFCSLCQNKAQRNFCRAICAKLPRMLEAKKMQQSLIHKNLK